MSSGTEGPEINRVESFCWCCVFFELFFFFFLNQRELEKTKSLIKPDLPFCVQKC